MRVRLTRKYAEKIDGVSLAGCEPGDVLELDSIEARLLIAEQWAIPERRRELSEASDRPTRREVQGRRREAKASRAREG
jgi:hypothetical protein